MQAHRTTIPAYGQPSLRPGYPKVNPTQPRPAYGQPSPWPDHTMTLLARCQPSLFPDQTMGRTVRVKNIQWPGQPFVVHPVGYAMTSPARGQISPWPVQPVCKPTRGQHKPPHSKPRTRLSQPMTSPDSRAHPRSTVPREGPPVASPVCG
jgi:hypothetical protein